MKSGRSFALGGAFAGLIAFGIADAAGQALRPGPGHPGAPVQLAQAPQAPVREITKIAGEVYRFRNNFHFSVFAVTPAGIIVTDPINADAARWLEYGASPRGTIALDQCSRAVAWLDGRRMRAAVASDVNEDIRTRTGGDFTAKDFRTLRGTIAAADRLAEIGVERTARARARAVREAFEYTSSVLGNTPAIAKASYVDPRVVAAYEHGRTIDRRGLRETALLALLVDDA